ncbi:RNA-binding S4 domain-containing protein [Candidatus Darwinibacter acetoxidans]|nr:RNA-binding S4 domain-containing protein [Bacillota bacterium]
MKEIRIKTSTIQLDQFLKWAGIASTGGEAKVLIQSGAVKVNGQVETARSRKLEPGAKVDVGGETFLVRLDG